MWISREKTKELIEKYFNGCIFWGLSGVIYSDQFKGTCIEKLINEITFQNEKIESIQKQNKLLMDYLKVEIVTDPERTYVKPIDNSDDIRKCTNALHSQMYNYNCEKECWEKGLSQIYPDRKMVECTLPEGYTLKVNGEVIEVKGTKKGTKKGGKKC